MLRFHANQEWNAAGFRRKKSTEHPITPFAFHLFSTSHPTVGWMLH